MANIDEKIKVSIVCGHGKQTNGVWDSGATYGSEQEAKRMLPITKHFVELAEINGFEVITDVPKNNINMIEQVKLANKEKVDVHIAIHCDWYKASSGSFGLYCKGSTKGKKLATCLNTYVKKLTGIRSKGVIARTDLYELNQTNMPACVFECGSIKADRYEWDTAKEADEYGKALCMGLCKYYGKTFVEKKATTTKPVATTEKKPTTTTKKKSVEAIAKEVIAGKWGNGADRKKKLTAAGYNYSTVQKKVNELLK